MLAHAVGRSYYSTTLNPIDDEGDGYIGGEAHPTWAAAHDDTSQGVFENSGSPGAYGNAEVAAAALHDGSNYKIRRGAMIFDTSAIPDTADILSVTIRLYVETADDPGSSETLDVVSFAPASDALAAGDYDAFGTTVYAATLVDSLTTSSYNDFSLSAAGIADIDATGNSSYGIRMSHDTDDTAPGASTTYQVVCSSTTTATNLPQLVVEYFA